MTGSASALPPPFYLEPVDLLPRSAAERVGGIPALSGSATALNIVIWRPGQERPRTVLPAASVACWLRSVSLAEASRASAILESWAKPTQFAHVLPRVEARPALMGVLNITPDSFYADSRQSGRQSAVALGAMFLSDGAAILEIGSQSTRPNSRPIASTREAAEALPTVAALAKTGAVISIDTVHPGIAAAGVGAGAKIVNDVTGLMPVEVLGKDASLIIGHMRGNPTTMQQWPRSARGIFSLYDWLEARITALVDAGLPKHRIAVDPGFGFGKAVNHNQAIIRHLPLLTGLGVAIVIGMSRKGSLGYVAGAAKAGDRLPASLAGALIAARSGAAIVRVHDVAATRQALQTARFFS